LKIIEKVELSDLLCQGIAEVYNSAGMGGQHSDTKLRMMYKAASYFLLAEEHGRVVGLLRAFGDSTVVTWLAEVAVHTDHRRKGFGTQLVQRFLDHHRHTAVFTFCIKGRGQEAFFDAAGLSPKDIITGCSRAAQKKHAA